MQLVLFPSSSNNYQSLEQFFNYLKRFTITRDELHSLESCFDKFGPPTASCDKHKDIFKVMGKLWNYQLKLPVQKNVRRLSYHTRKKVSKEIKRLLENDCIKKAEGPTNWVNPIVVAPISNDLIRIYLDM